MENATDRNVPDLELVVSFDGPVRSFSEVPDFGLPRPPRIWGPWQATFLPSVASLAIPTIRPQSSVIAGFRSNNSGSTQITFDPVHLRPRATVRMPPVDLVVDCDDNIVTGRWSATSGAIDGITTGSVEVAIALRVGVDILLASEDDSAPGDARPG